MQHLNTLPTTLNLQRWKIQCGAKCPLCGNSRPTVAHVLNGCPVALEQGRYTWHHDCPVQYYLHFKTLYPHGDYYICRPPQRKSYRTPSQHNSTIYCVVTPLKPDLVLLRKDNQATVIELTCPTNKKTNLAEARSRQQNKEVYGILFSDMSNQGWSVDYETLEIGSLGHVQREMPTLLSSVLGLPKQPTRNLLDRCAKAAISCSYYIFLARNSPSWSSRSILTF